MRQAVNLPFGVNQTQSYAVGDTVWIVPANCVGRITGVDADRLDRPVHVTVLPNDAPEHGEGVRRYLPLRPPVAPAWYATTDLTVTKYAE